MSSSTGKSPVFLLLLSWLAICSPTVFAQKNLSEQISLTAVQAQVLENEPETKVSSFSEKLLNNEVTHSPNLFQKNVERGKTIRSLNEGLEFVEDEKDRLTAKSETKNNDFAYHFPSTSTRERQLEFRVPADTEKQTLSSHPKRTHGDSFDDTKNAASRDDPTNVDAEGFRWRSAIGQTLMFLAVQHGYAFTQPKTREALKGKFWKDYVDSVKSLRGWADGGRFFTNYIAHPMQGSLLGYIQIQNDPKGRKQQFGTSGDYWRSRLKAMAWSAAWSTQFEIGPISQASIGNVGLKGKQTYIDIVVTPTVGTAWLIGEDAVDRLIMKRIERYTDNFYVRIFSRMLLSPTRNFSNMFRFKPPWHRDRPVAR